MSEMTESSRHARCEQCTHAHAHTYKPSALPLPLSLNRHSACFHQTRRSTLAITKGSSGTCLNGVIFGASGFFVPSWETVVPAMFAPLLTGLRRSARNNNCLVWTWKKSSGNWQWEKTHSGRDREIPESRTDSEDIKHKAA